MSDDKELIGLMVRLPSDLHEQVKRFAAGDGRRPRASLNAAIVFLLRVGLATVAQEEKQRQAA